MSLSLFVCFSHRWAKAVWTWNPPQAYKLLGLGHVWHRRTFLPSASWLSWLGLHHHPQHTLPSSVFVCTLCGLYGFTSSTNAAVLCQGCILKCETDSWRYKTYPPLKPKQCVQKNINQLCVISLKNNDFKNMNCEFGRHVGIFWYWRALLKMFCYNRTADNKHPITNCLFADWNFSLFKALFL